jgi:hypothetical protein
MNGLLIWVAKTAAPSGFATVSEPPLELVAPDEPFDEQPVSASALMAAIADTVIKVFLSLIASPSDGHIRCALWCGMSADNNLLTGLKASRGYWVVSFHASGAK